MRIMTTIFTAFMLLIFSSCGVLSSDVSHTVPVLWMYESVDREGQTNVLYVKQFGGKVTKVAADLLVGSHVADGEGKMLLYLDGNKTLFLTGDEQTIKMADNVALYQYQFSGDGQKVYFKTASDELYTHEIGKNTKKLAERVKHYQVNGDQVNYIDYDNRLKHAVGQGSAEDIGTDVASFSIQASGTSIEHTSNKGILYSWKQGEGEQRISEGTAGEYHLSSDSTMISYIDHYDVLTGSGDLVLAGLQSPSEPFREKIASEVASHSLSEDGSYILYHTKHKELFLYEVSTGKKEQIAAHVTNYFSSGQHQYLIYHTEANELYGKELNEAPVRVDSDVIWTVMGDNQETFYVTKENELYRKSPKGNKQKLLSGIKQYVADQSNLYYVTPDNEIGMLREGDPEGMLLLENPKSYDLVYSRGFLLYQDAGTGGGI